MTPGRTFVSAAAFVGRWEEKGNLYLVLQKSFLFGKF